MDNELELLFENEAEIYLPQIIADENKRKANEHERTINELERQENEILREKLATDYKKISYIKEDKKTYITKTTNENTFGLPEQYTETSMLWVFVNGMRLNEKEYLVNTTNSTVRLINTLDVVGTVVEIVILKTAVALEIEYDTLKGKSAYESAVENGFQGTEAEWLRSLKGSGGFSRNVSYYTTTTTNENTFELSYEYNENSLLDVYINGFKLNDNEYSVVQNGEKYNLVLTKALDVIGTVVEVDIIEVNKADITVDTEVIENSKNAVSGGAVKTYIDTQLGNIESLLSEV